MNSSDQFSIVEKERFRRLMQTNKTLVELDLIDSTAFSNEVFLENIFQILQKHNSIKQFRLHISLTDKYSDRNEVRLINFLEKYQFLTHFHLSNSTISPKLIQSLIDNIQNYRSIIHLEFPQCNFNEDDIRPLILLENNGILFSFIYSKQPQKTSSPKSKTGKFFVMFHARIL